LQKKEKKNNKASISWLLFYLDFGFNDLCYNALNNRDLNKMNKISQSSEKAKKRFLEIHQVHAILYLINPKDLEIGIRSAVQNGVNLKCDFIESDSESLLYTRKIRLNKNQFKIMKNDLEGVCRKDDGERIVASLLIDVDSIIESNKRMNPLDVNALKNSKEINEFNL